MTQVPAGALRRGLGAAAGLALIMLLVQLLPQAWQDQLRYERAAVAAGQVWRLATANLVHLGWSHFALNLAGLGLIAWIFGPDRSAWRWALALLLSGLATSLGVYLFSPEIHWMVGLSGALHGLFVCGAVGWLAAGDRFGWLLLAGVTAKLAFEQLVGEVPLTAAIVGGSVVTDAHLWGAAGGLLAGVLEWPRWRGQGASL